MSMNMSNMGNIGESLSKVFQQIGADTDLEKLQEGQVANKVGLQQDAESAEPPFIKLKTKSISSEKRANKTAKLQKQKGLGGIEKSQKQKERNANGFQARNPEMKADKLLRILAKLKGKTTSTDIMKALQEEFKDPVLIHEAMNFLLENSAEDDPELHQAVQNTQDQYLASHEKEIRAGINIGSVVLKYAKTPEKAPELRSLYNDITGNPREAKDLFNELSTKYTYKELKNVIDFLFNALGKDLNAEGSSIEPGKLKNLIYESNTLRAIVGTYRCFKERMPLVEKLFAENNEPIPQKVNFQSMAQAFIALLGDRYPTSDKVLSSAEKMGLQTITAKIIYIEAERDAVRGVSPRVYNSEPHRDEINSAILGALDNLYIDQEFEEDKMSLETNKSHLTLPDIAPEKTPESSGKVLSFEDIFDNKDNTNSPAA